MQFNNADFEKKSKDTIRSLKDLESNLKMDGATSGLDKIKTALSGFSISPLVKGASEAGSGFTNMSIAGVTAIQEITRKVVDLGLSITQNLGNKLFGPMMSGFGEYQTQMGAVQTVLTNTADKGTTLKDVNKAFSELNTYADKTIYNFAEMTRNIGTFTAAGVDLDKATSSIKGIANLAAGSGSSAQQASVAMYQLSQAIASGTVKLQDWNSVVSAGMSGQLFQKELQKTAESYGVNVDELIKKNGTFRDSLHEGWLTADILTETLSRFADESTDIGKRLTAAATEVKTVGELFDSMGESLGSGWSRLWQIIIGDYDEAKLVLTDIFNTFDKVVGGMFNGVISTAESWKELGGRAKLIDTARLAFQKLSAIASTVKKTLEKIIPPVTGQTIFDLTNKLYNFIDGISTSRVDMIRFSNILKGITSIFLIFKQAVTGIKSVFEPLKPLITNVIMKLSEIGYYLNAVRESNIILIAANAIWAKLGGIMTNIVKAFEEVFPLVLHTTNATDTLKNIVIQLLTFVSGILNVVKDPLVVIAKGLFSIYHILFNIISSFVRAMSQATFLATIIKWLGAIASKIASVFINIDETTSKSDTFFKIFSKIVEFLNGAVALMDSIFNGAVSSINSFFEAFKKSTGIDIPGIFSNIVNGIGSAFNSLLSFDINGVFASMQNAISSFTSSVNGVINKFFPSKKVEQESKAINKSATETKQSMNIFDTAFGLLSAAFEKVKEIFSKLRTVFSNFNLADAAKKSVFIFLDAFLIKITFFRKSIGKTIGEIFKSNPFKKADGIMNELKNIFGELKKIGSNIADVFEQFGKVLEAYQMKLNAQALKEISIAIAILAVSLLLISVIDNEKILSASSAIAALFAELVSTMAVMQKTTGKAEKLNLGAVGTAMIKVAAAVLIMAIALRVLSSVDAEKLTNGTLAIEALLGGLTIAANNFNKMEGGMKNATKGLISLGVTVLLLAAAMKLIASIPQDALLSSLGVVEALLGSLVLASKILDSSSGGVKQATKGLMKMAISVILLSVAMKIVASIEPDALERSVGVVITLLAALTMASKLLASDTKRFSSASKIILMFGISVLLISSALKSLSTLPVEGLFAAAAALSTIMLVISVAINNLTKNSTNISAAINTGFILASVMGSLKEAAEAIEILANLPVSSMGVAVAALVILIGVILSALKNVQNNISLGTPLAIAAMGISIRLMADALAVVADLPTANVAVAALALAGLIGVLGLFSSKVKPKDMLALAPAMLVFSLALIQMGLAMAIISAIGIKGAALAVGAIAAVLLTIALGMRLIKPVISVMYKFAGALALIGASMLIVSAAILVFAVAFAIIIGAINMIGPDFFVKAQEGILAFLTVIHQVFGQFLLDLIASLPTVLDLLWTVVGNYLMDTLENIMQLLIKFLTLAVKYAPTIVKLILDLLIAIFDVLIKDEKTKTLIEDISVFLMQTLEGLLEGLTKEIPTLVHDLFEFIATFLESLHKELSTNGQRIAKAIADIIGDLIDMAITAIEELFSRLAQTGYRIGWKIGEGLKSAGKWLKEKIVEPIKNGYEAIKKKFSDFLQAGKNIINNIVNGIKKVGGNIITKVKEYINNAINWIKGLPEQLKQSGINFIQGFIDGITSIGDSVKKKIEEIGGNIVDWFNHAIGNASPSKKAKKSAKFYFQGFINGTSEMMSKVTESVGNVGTAINKALDDVQDQNSIITEITPVINMDKLQMDKFYLSDMFSNLEAMFSGLSFDVPDISFETEATRILNVNNTDVIKAIQAINNKVDILSEYLSSTNIYLDKSTLVGKLATPLDKELGTMAGQRRRRKL